MAVRLAQAALGARNTVAIRENGAVDTDDSRGLIQITLTEDRPAPEPRRASWLEFAFALVCLAFLTLGVIGFITVVGWLVKFMRL